MSAYMIDRNHVRFLIEAGLSSRIRGMSPLRWFWTDAEGKERDATLTGDTAAAVGQMLWDENHASVCARYPEDDLPGPTDQDFVYSEHHRSSGIVNPAQVLKSCHCLRYQSCEHEGWNKSQACAFVESLCDSASRRVEGYEEAQWGAPDMGSTVVSLMDMVKKPNAGDIVRSHWDKISGIDQSEEKRSE